MALVYEPEPHRYTLDGTRVPSVTQILRSGKLVNFDEVPLDVLALSLERGTRVHEAIHAWHDHHLDEQAFMRDFPQWAGYLQAWLAFFQRRAFIPILSEHPVASRRHQLAGTIDCLGYLDGQRCIAEIKTGNPADVAADLQTAAYHALALEWAREQDADPRLAEFLPKGCALHRLSVQLTEDGTFRVEVYTSPGDYREFMVGVQWYHICARRKRTQPVTIQ